MIVTLGAVVGGIAVLIKGVWLVNLAITPILSFTPYQVAWHKTFGIYLEYYKPMLGF